MSYCDKTMRINAPKGQKVNFKGPRDLIHGGGHAGDGLEDEGVYTVKETKVFSSISMVILEELPDEEFNTVMFEETGEVLEATQSTGELYRQGVEERKICMLYNIKDRKCRSI